MRPDPRTGIGLSSGALRGGSILAGLFLSAILFPGCGPRLIPPERPMARVEVGYVENGTASWYGSDFHGRKTSSGETYNMHDMTAAHRTLPFQTVVRVENTATGGRADVRINDRGPFVAGRFLDLSYGAAKALEIVGPGTAKVQMTVIGLGPPSPDAFWLQIGAFAEIKNAERLKERMTKQFPGTTVFEHTARGGIYYRVRVGIFRSENEAREASSRLAREGFSPLLVRADDIP